MDRPLRHRTCWHCAAALRLDLHRLSRRRQAIAGAWPALRAAVGPLYELQSLGGFFYLPISLVIYAPFTAINPSLAAAFWMAAFAAVFTWGCCRLMLALLPNGAGDLKAVWLAGVMLLLNDRPPGSISKACSRRSS